MQIKLENIGIVKNSSIELNGLTVITGKNNSGKSTVGKTVYALLDSVSNISEKYNEDISYYIKRNLKSIQNNIGIFKMLEYIDSNDNDKNVLDDFPYLKMFVKKNKWLQMNYTELKEFIKKVTLELEMFESSKDVRELLEEEREERILAYLNHFSRFLNKDEKVKGRVGSQCSQARSALDWLLKEVEKNEDYLSYIKESVNYTLRKEFIGQIQPVRGQKGKSKIEISEGEQVYFRINIENNNLKDEIENIVTLPPYEKVYLIDDPFVLDNIPEKKMAQEQIAHENSFLNSGHILYHNDKLRLILTENNNNQSIFEQTILNGKLKNIRKKIDKILPGTFDLSTEGRYYVQNGMKLQVSNLATGSKMFSIIKILLGNCETSSQS